MAKIVRKPTKVVGFAINNSVPSYIFHNKNYTVLESLIVYLKEKRKLSFRKIATLIGRDFRDMHKQYHNAKAKQLVTEYRISTNFFQIPISIFANRRLSGTEALVLYLKDEVSLTKHEISVVMDRDDSTIWTVYKRATEKKKNWRLNAFEE